MIINPHEDVKTTIDQTWARVAGPREQINQLSAYMDGSMLYGSDECLARKLRENNGEGARMRVFPHPLTSSGGQFKGTVAWDFWIFHRTDLPWRPDLAIFAI